MSLFCVTQSLKDALRVQNDYNKIFCEKSTLYQLADNIILILTTGFKKNSMVKKVGHNHTFIIGTIFNELGFNNEILDSITNCDMFEESFYEEPQRYFGHFIVIIYHEGDCCLKIMTDRIGCLNVYYTTCMNGKVCISNDLLEISKISRNTELDSQAVAEFLMTESNINKRTMFQRINRLCLGKCLIMQHDVLQEKNIYQYQIEHQDIKGYMERIDRYFFYINQYKGKIGVDLSGGFDTRLVASIAYKNIDSFIGFSANNESDGGIDRKISLIIADLLNIPYNYLDYSDFPELEERREMLYHGTSILRDSHRSKKWPLLFKERFSACELSLGGYGGEIVRAKYNIYSSTKRFIKYYYNGFQAERLCGIINYQKNVQEELNSYQFPKISEEYKQNWYYAMAKMRIWGSAYLQMASLYGDVIHPFLDWYLMGPVFGFSLNELYRGKLQKEIIDTYAPQLKKVPINRGGGVFEKRIEIQKKCTERFIHSRISETKVMQYFLCKGLEIRYARERKNSGNIFPKKDAIQKESLDFFKILYHSGVQVGSRMRHVIEVKEYLDSALKNLQEE